MSACVYDLWMYAVHDELVRVCECVQVCINICKWGPAQRQPAGAVKSEVLGLVCAYAWQYVSVCACVCVCVGVWGSECVCVLVWYCLLCVMRAGKHAHPFTHTCFNN